MPIYVFTCPKNHVTEEYRSIKDYTPAISCRCGAQATITITDTLHVRTFKPYIEENFNGKPIEITSSKQRDELCKKHGVTYDSAKYIRKPKFKSAVEDIDFAEVKAAAERGRLNDGTKIEKPVKTKEAFDKHTKVIK